MNEANDLLQEKNNVPDDPLTEKETAAGECPYAAKTGALILSGGKSRRMGRDKTTLEYRGESFLERAAGFWSEVPGISDIYLGIGSEEHLQKILEDEKAAGLIREKHLIPVTDIYKECGPMAGIHAAFLAGDEDWLYVCAIDIPNIDRTLLPVPEEYSGTDKAADKVSGSAEAEEYAGTDGAAEKTSGSAEAEAFGPADAYVYKYKDMTEPLFALYSRRTLKPMEEMLENGSYKLQDLLERVRTKYLPLKEEQLCCFFNCNTPEDLEKIMTGAVRRQKDKNRTALKTDKPGS